MRQKVPSKATDKKANTTNLENDLRNATDSLHLGKEQISQKRVK